VLGWHGVSHPLPDCCTVGSISIAQEAGRGLVPRKRLHSLLGRPLRGRLPGHVEVDDASAVVGEDQEDEENSESDRGDGEEVSLPKMPNHAARRSQW
jgi:hypothetical protein